MFDNYFMSLIVATFTGSNLMYGIVRTIEKNHY